MNKKWLTRLADDIEKKYGKDTRDRIFGDIDSMVNSPDSISAWFEKFTSGMDKLDNNEFLRAMMAERCPCGGDYKKNGQEILTFYNNSETLDEFVNFLKERYPYPTDGDLLELHGNVLYMTKPLSNNKGQGRCGQGCHCWLAMYTDKAISDIFCYCCTIGHTGRPFKIAFGDDIKMEFIESIICGGTKCIMTVHLPEKKHKIITKK
jgi:hypothetical protein